VNIVVRPVPVATTSPSTATKRSRWGVVIFFACIFLVSLARLGLKNLASYIGLLLAVAALTVLLTVFVSVANRMFRKNATLFVKDGMVGVTTSTGSQRAFPVSDVSRVIQQCVMIGGVSQPYVIFVSKTGRCLFKLASRYWLLGDIQRVCNAFSIPMESDEGITKVRPADVNVKIPGTFSWVTILLGSRALTFMSPYT